MNPFGKNGGPSNDVPMSKWDLSFQNNLTFNFGALVPVCLIPTLERDKFDISCTFGLRFMPTVFPIQTRIKASIDFFYVRNRNLWSGWMDWYTKMDDSLVFPYISSSVSNSLEMFSTGSLGDYLGLPTIIHGRGPSSFVDTVVTSTLYCSDTPVNAGGSNLPSEISIIGRSAIPPSGYELSVINSSMTSTYPYWTLNLFERLLLVPLKYPSTTIVSSMNLSDGGSQFPAFFGAGYDEMSTNSVANFDDAVLYSIPRTVGSTRRLRTICSVVSSDGSYLGTSVVILSATVIESSSRPGTTDLSVDVSFDSTDNQYPETAYYKFHYYYGMNNGTSLDVGSISNFLRSLGTNATAYGSIPLDSISIPDSLQPWDPSVSRCNVLPFRAYEQIYNSFYRDERNNPYILNNKKVYNKFLPSIDGGPDSNVYGLHYRNWEQDFLTTAVPTPQQGVAPLVGISSTGKASFVASEDGSLYEVEAVTGDDHDTITGFNMTENLPSSVSRALVNVATSGISINDFRNVNAFQRWLETNIRKGYKYKDVLKSHFDVDIAYNVLDMPEYLGSVHCDVKPQTVTQTVESSSDPLGSYAGQLYGVGGSNNHIRKFCDENGYIIGILSVVPVPNYSQLMAKEWFRGTDPFDFYWPEFSNIGLQPILKKEVAPIQLIYESKDEFNTAIFGYQRAWYDYLQRTDEVHGLFRTQLDNFVMNRSFSTTPTLGPDFTVVDPSQLNEVFSVTDITDKILGQVYFDINALRPIPRFGVPRLE
ncbi:major capsid protein [Dipodfec virus UOA04_Rod_466]|nr:major capsid protein [Dipodfec virus UOA04_Rod_466]